METIVYRNVEPCFTTSLEEEIDELEELKLTVEQEDSKRLQIVRGMLQEELEKRVRSLI